MHTRDSLCYSHLGGRWQFWVFDFQIYIMHILQWT